MDDRDMLDKIIVKWTAPEAMYQHKYSIASDIWSYGCLLYEIWSLGRIPFKTLSNKEVGSYVAKLNLLHDHFSLSSSSICLLNNLFVHTHVTNN